MECISGSGWKRWQRRQRQYFSIEQPYAIRDAFGGSVWREGSMLVVNRLSCAVQAGYQPLPTPSAQVSGTSGHLRGLCWDPAP